MPHLVTEVTFGALTNMATVSAIPEKFESGDFVTWLCNFENCATTNGWKDDHMLKKLGY